ncbi:14047_t:CDS:2, partial [Rhizophagus irregularis]
IQKLSYDICANRSYSANSNNFISNAINGFIGEAGNISLRANATAKLDSTSGKRKKWMVNSTISNEESKLVYFIDPTESSGPLYAMIQKGEFVALYGARASGKSTRVDQAKIELESKGYVCIYISFEGVNMDTIDTFWTCVGVELYIDSPQYFGLNDVKSASDFKLKFRKEQWNDKQVVLFIDEYDELFGAKDDVKSSFLAAIRSIKNTKRSYALWSSVVIGPLSILFLKSDKINVSPFNVKEPFRNPNFTLAQVESLYKAYGKDAKLTIAPEVIKDIYERTNGHAGLVCLCGKAISYSLVKKLDEGRSLDFKLWSKFLVSSLMFNSMIMYLTFKKMVDDLLRPDAKEALDFLRSVFIGFFDFIQINIINERRLADFLTVEGVLIRKSDTEFSYRMSSIFVDGLVRREVIPLLYKSCPTIPVPRIDEDYLKVLDVLIESIRCFDKTIICNAFKRSFKTALVKVGGRQNRMVPRESVYDTELNRILVNWIVNECNFEVTGQWHLIDHADNDEKDKHYYSDITIMTPCQTVVLELLASANKKELNEHFERVLNYAEMLSADDKWIVNFTCEDDATKNPHWPPNDRKFESVNVVHFYHDRKFENVRMSARYISDSGTFSYITDQVIQLQ